ncbi:hypothetical protein F383_34218 [Gossypium arboreum]|uniref:Uncharacterized protein n=1 Tax=Gossypium arboreum TaxID=29729 RepID=A0A0B0PS61_GOSAR|nr:hypothetical protein F383_34218 [Gossypium arboreum]
MSGTCIRLELYKLVAAKVARGSSPYVREASHTIPKAFGQMSGLS